MAFQPVPGVALVELRATLDGEQIENTLHFYNNSNVWTQADLATLATMVKTHWTLDIMPQLSTAYILREVVATDLSIEGSYQETVTTGLPAAGADSAEQMPNNVALCVSFRTGYTGRRSRGRNYISGATISDVVGNQFTSTFANAMVAGYEGLMEGVFIAAGFVWVVVSRWEDGVKLPNGVWRAINSVLVVDLDVDSQRRRLPGRGR